MNFPSKEIQKNCQFITKIEKLDLDWGGEGRGEKDVFFYLRSKLRINEDINEDIYLNVYNINKMLSCARVRVAS